MPLQLTERDGGVSVAVKVVPGSSRDRLAGEYGGGIKVTVTAPPQAGAANKAVIALLAEVLDIPAARIKIKCGHTAARKEVTITGIAAQTVRDRLSRQLGL